jgi:hypothetical protein
MPRLPVHLLTSLVLLASLATPGLAEERASVRAQVRVNDKAQLRELLSSDYDVSRSHGQELDMRLAPSQVEELRARGFQVIVITEDLYASRDGLRGGSFLPEYVSYSEASAELASLAATYPSITALSSLGQSLEGREMWALKISDNPGVDEDEPEVLICGNHHAREVISVIIPLHIAEELLSGYGTDPDYTDWVNNREIWIVPVVNPDGLTYVESTDLFWRKNRRGGYGVDLNRNYETEWGHDNNGSSSSTSSATYRGASPASEPETQNMQALFNSRNFVYSISYHSHGNLILWGPGHKPGLTEDEDVFAGFGDVVSAQNSYLPGNPATGTIYITNGDSDDFGYAGAGHSKVYSMTPEVGTSSDYFNPPANRIPTLTAEGAVCGWEAIRYADRPEQLAPPGPPALDALPTDADGNYDVTWNAPTLADTEVVQYEIVEKTAPSTVTDNLEGGAAAFELGGWTVSGSRSASGSFSLYSGSGNEFNRIVWANEDHLVQPGEDLTFNAWYDIENAWDYAYVIASTDGGRSFVNLAGTNTTMSDANGNNADNGITGSSGGWIPMTFDLAALEGEWVRFGFRYYTDSFVNDEGIYVDDIHPVQDWGSRTTLSAAVGGTTFPVAGQSDGTYFYSVRGLDAEGDWGYWAANRSVTVELQTGIDTSGAARAFSLSPARPNPFAAGTQIRFSLPATSEHSLVVFNVAGRRVKTLSSGVLAAGPHAITWDGRNEEGQHLPSGVYFCTLRSAAGSLQERVVLQR